MAFLKEIAGEQAQLVSLRRYLHAHPELPKMEFETAAFIEKELEEAGIFFKRVGETGVYGEIKGALGDSPIIVLRADIDALPILQENEAEYCSKNVGVMHACGHDMHTACLLQAAKALKRRQAEFGGTVRLFFQQAEEVGYGANIFLQEGLFEGAEHVFGIHSAPDLPVGKVGVKPGPNNASVDCFKVHIHGKAAHVSTPELGADALFIAAQTVVALQSIVTRQTSPIDSVIIGVGKMEAGTAYNIVAEDARLEGTTRLFTLPLRKEVNARVEAVVMATAALYDASAEIEWIDYAPPLVNDEKVCLEIGALVQDLFGKEALVTNRPLSCGGDDFARFLLEAPGAYAYVGTASDAVQGSRGPAHNSRFDIDEKALPIGAALYADCAWMWLRH